MQTKTKELKASDCLERKKDFNNITQLKIRTGYSTDSALIFGKLKEFSPKLKKNSETYLIAS